MGLEHAHPLREQHGQHRTLLGHHPWWRPRGNATSSVYPPGPRRLRRPDRSRGSRYRMLARPRCVWSRTSNSKTSPTRRANTRSTKTTPPKPHHQNHTTKTSPVTPARIRTVNLLLRRQTPCPLGHGGGILSLSKNRSLNAHAAPSAHKSVPLLSMPRAPELKKGAPFA